ncbi:MAG: hypothetical protein M3Y09_10700 [Actinomycetota bacterium]|nr:hypothetical protein [Actinomycetota bacterium]
MYLTHKTYVSGTAAWFMDALDVTNGQERAGFPVRLDGNADNNSATSFFARDQQQRPGLLLMNGVVYAAFWCATDTSSVWLSHNLTKHVCHERRREELCRGLIT